MIDIKAIRKLCHKATPGPWKIGTNSLIVDANGKALFFEPGGKYNAKFIAKSRTLIPALLDELEAAQNAHRWIPVTDRLPDHHRLVLTYLNCGTYSVTFIQYDGKWNGDCDDGKVTHWMPLPEPPKGESHE